jgi:hypothetical protein
MWNLIKYHGNTIEQDQFTNGNGKCEHNTIMITLWKN